MQVMLCVAVMLQCAGHILVTWVPVQSKHRCFVLPTRGLHGWLDNGSHFLVRLGNTMVYYYQ